MRIGEFRSQTRRSGIRVQSIQLVTCMRSSKPSNQQSSTATSEAAQQTRAPERPGRTAGPTQSHTQLTVALCSYARGLLGATRGY